MAVYQEINVIPNAAWSGLPIGTSRNQGQSYQDWAMNNQFDSNLDCHKMDRIFTEDLVYESRSSKQSGSDDEDVPP